MARAFLISIATAEGDACAYANRHHTALSSALGIDLKHAPSDTAFRHVFLQMDIKSLGAAIRERTIAQIPEGAEGLEQRVCNGQTMRGSLERMASGG